MSLITIKDDLYGWIITLIVPLNSVINPVILLIPELKETVKKRKKRKLEKE